MSRDDGKQGDERREGQGLREEHRRALPRLSVDQRQVCGETNRGRGVQALPEREESFKEKWREMVGEEEQKASPGGFSEGGAVEVFQGPVKDSGFLLCFFLSVSQTYTPSPPPLWC